MSEYTRLDLIIKAIRKLSMESRVWLAERLLADNRKLKSQIAAEKRRKSLP